MPAESPNVVVLGAGVTGLTVAWELSKVYGDKVVLLEKESAVGGLASTFTRKDLSFDTGSHRLHDGYSPEVDRLIRVVEGYLPADFRDRCQNPVRRPRGVIIDRLPGQS